MRPFLTLTAAAVAVLTLTGCAASMSVSSHFQRGLDFMQYRTFDWGPADALPTGDPRLDENPFFQDYLEGAVERTMAFKGYERSVSGTPDLQIHYHATIARRIDVNRLDDQFGYCFDEDCQVRVFEVEEGTLVLDVVDARANRVIWRGWAQHGVADMLEDPDRMAERINEAVGRILERLPSAGTSGAAAR